MTGDATALRRLLDAIAKRDDTAFDMLDASPQLARAVVEAGATRSEAQQHYLAEIGCHVYAGDTALHIAAAAYRTDLAQRLIDAGAGVRARNRRGAEPLHYAATGAPGSARWNPEAQSAIIACLIALGADPNAVDKSGVAPLHRAVRTRCAAAVRALLEGGADAQQKNGNGSSPMLLATHQTGRGGSGSAEAKVQQAQIIELLERVGATR